MSPSSPWWRPDRHADRRPFLMARMRIQRAIRQALCADNFIEVETDCLQPSPGNETHLHAFATEWIGPDLARHALYLPTSPELAMKKLIAAGEPRIFQFAPSFRNRERGPLHAPQFTMLEWYRAGLEGFPQAGADEEPEKTGDEADFEVMIGDALSLITTAAEAAGTQTLRYRDREAAVDRVRLMRVDVALASILSLDIETVQAAIRRGNDAAMRDISRAAGLRVGADDTWSSLFSKLVTVLEPNLCNGEIVVLTHYPVSQSAFACADPLHPRLALRFEVYACGVELANGCCELVSGREQRVRLDAQMAERRTVYGEAYPIDDDFIAAVGSMPNAAGCAIGFDRLVMLATGASHIDHVRWTPQPA
ncbi:MAG: amino acid--tRNA ligase-related protein [Hyphomicrobiaceae bacterium]|nr:amino acid--tRNA ligase-related protein [Hyphomicrobiaceae bacterium]